MEKANLALVDDPSVGDWIRESLHPWVLFSDIPVTIGIVIPRGYESYVLVRHSRPGDRHGGLGDETLSRHGKSSKFIRAIFLKNKLLRLIYGQIGAYARMRRIRSQVQSQEHLPSLTLPKGIMASKRFELPNRNYLLMFGSIEEATKVGWNFVRSFQLQSSNLLWPIDRKWILVTEIDFNVTDAIDGLPVAE